MAEHATAFGAISETHPSFVQRTVTELNPIDRTLVLALLVEVEAAIAIL
jgi:hypothetical protein